MKLKRIVTLEFGMPLLRKALKKIYKEGSYYRVWFGKLRGLKSYYRQDINFHTLIGRWETENINALDKAVRKLGLNGKDIVIADVGANMGYYTMYFAKYFSPKTRIYAFEPSLSILDVLKHNISANHFDNVEIIEAACSENTGTVEFYIGHNHHSSSVLDSWGDNLASGTRTTVKSVSLDDFFGNTKKGDYPDLIKMDIEGGGVYALKGCEQCLKIKRPLILMESHTAAEDGAIGHVLQQFDYEAFRIETNKWVLNKDKDYRDAEGVWGKMLLIPAEKKQQFKN
ncbi:MAG: FkbM family methyltransferase [Chitinophagales bacterium]